MGVSSGQWSGGEKSEPYRTPPLQLSVIQCQPLRRSQSPMRRDIMDQPFDLSIILSSPPPDSPPDRLASITVQCDSLNFQRTSTVLLPELLTEEEHHRLNWYLEE